MAKPAGIRFRSRYVDGGPGCWIWCGAVTSAGYGSFRPGGGLNPMAAHRYAYWLHYGTFDESLCVCHHCDNPLCVNPAHLFLGTRADNNMDKARKGRASRNGGARGERNHTTKLRAVDVDAIRCSPLSQSRLSAVYGVSSSQIGRIKRREEWRHG